MAARVFLILAFAAAAAFASADMDVKRMFYQWAETYNKQYPTLSEREYRLSVFNASLARIAERNRNSKSAVFAPNKFSDLTPAEFKNMYLMKDYKPVRPADAEVTKPAKMDVPATYDWRKANAKAVTPVKNQEQCGSCWAFSATETLESVWVLAGNPQVILSEQQTVDCDTQDSGCNGGNTNTAYEYMISAGGVETEKDYPYQGVDGECHFKKSDVAATIKGWKYGTSNNDEKTLQANLVSIAPLSICVDAEPWQDYSSGVLTADQCGDSLDHCVQLVGYDSTASTPYWMVRNSWDTTWGIEGYIWLEMWKDTCGMASDVTYPIAGSSPTSSSTTSTSSSSGTGEAVEFDENGNVVESGEAAPDFKASKSFLAA